ncbi:MAG: 50S ribosomal protein L25 [Acidimicrobiaceae bacterium]|nr:50S ribosomal protein L25 [Acidimicrobiaceae bacterium]|tara:strand:+ start:260 stop:952 length:693 start_codon:yes stop_codon:yes gene_type:complete
MAELVLNTEEGRALGSRSSRRLRREGRVPGVLYGLGESPQSFSVDYGDLRGSLTTEAGLNALIEIEIGGSKHLSILKSLQRHPVRDEVIHVDFVRVDPDAELSVDVRLVLTGDAKKVRDENGMVDQTMFNLSVFALPQSIPNELLIDVSELEINEAVRVGDISLPQGVRTEIDDEEAVAVGTVTRSTMEAMAAEALAEAAAEEAEEGEEGVSEEGEASSEDGEASAEDSE